MTVKIYHNPRCSKSRQTLALIRDAGHEPEIKEYLQTPPSYEELLDIFKKLKLHSALEMTRTKEPEFKESGLSKDSSNEDILKNIAKFPKLLERPVVITDKGARLGRPPENVKEIL
ncbi:MAG: arsenate reductase (glutaredoxin) [Alphaproteobacteria bacterium]|nr:arsenate reductase (glutaredoxin) [Alphaproteobacteria bacterium]